MPTKSQPIPPDYHTLTPHLTVRGAAQAIEFYKKAFDAQERCRMPGPDGQTVMHAEVQIGDSILMLNDEIPAMDCDSPQKLNGTPVAIHVYVNDVDRLFQRAIDAGAKALTAPADMFWGDRYGKLQDPFGHHWSIATHQYDLTPDEMKKAAEEAMGKIGSKTSE